MIPLKNQAEIRIVRKNSRRLAAILNQLLALVEPGVTLKEIEDQAVKLIRKAGATPSFKTVSGYHWATCLNVNEGVVHGVPGPYPLKKGDLLSLDIGLYCHGFHADMARTVLVGDPVLKVNGPKRKFLRSGQKALTAAIQAAKPGNHVGHISIAIEKSVKKDGYFPVEALTGHGIGRQLHEEPAVACLLKGKIKDTPRLKKGMVLALEVIYSRGKTELVLANDKWTLRTKDKSPAALFEDMVALSDQGTEVLTRCP